MMTQLLNWLNFTGTPMANWWADWGPSVLAFGIVALAVYLIARAWTGKPDAEKQRGNRKADLTRLQAPRTGAFGPMTDALASQIPESDKERRDFRRLLRQAGLYRPTAAASIYAARFVLLFVPLVIAGIVAIQSPREMTWPILIVGGLLAGGLATVPRLYVFFRRRRRMNQIRRALPDTIDMLSMCVSGGLGLSESLDHVSAQLTSYPELAEELQILKRQAEVGSLDQALADLTARVDLPEIRQLAALLTRGTRMGTRLASSLNEQADHLRTTRRQMATTRANKTPVKLVFPILFCMAPAALILLTAPAILELRNFFVPSAQTASAAPDAPPPVSFRTDQILKTLEDLEQATP